MLDGRLEENVLTGLVHSDTLAPHIVISVKPADFSISAYRTIASAAFDFLERHRQAPRAHIGDLLEEEIRRGPEGRFLIQVLQQLENLAPSLNEAYVRESLDRFVETQRMIKAVNDAADMLRDGNLEQARELLRAPGMAHKDAPGVWLRDSEQWLSFLREDQEPEFSSGIETLDDRGAVPARGELFTMLATAGAGKSWFLINCGKHNVLARRRNVLHITLENSLAVTLERYTQCFLACTQHEAKNLDLPVFNDPDANDPNADPGAARVDIGHGGPRLFEALRELGRREVGRRLEPYQRRGQLLVKQYPSGVLTFGMLTAYLDALERTEGFKPDLILLDYLTLMHIDDPRDLRVSIGNIARNLRGLASQRDCAIVTAAQANRDASGKRWVSSRHVAEDWSLVGTCDVFVTYSQSDFERDRMVARLMVEKARNGQDKWAAYVSQAYEIGQFAIDSCYHSKVKELGDSADK